MFYLHNGNEKQQLRTPARRESTSKARLELQMVTTHVQHEREKAPESEKHFEAAARAEASDLRVEPAPSLSLPD